VERFSLATGWTVHHFKSTGATPPIFGGSIMNFSSKTMLSLGVMVMLATTSMPVMATNIEQHQSASSAGDILEQASDGHRRRWRHRDRVDTGDVLTGIGILAGIAILADAASKSNKRDSRRDEPRYEDRQESSDYGRDDDLGAAVSVCSNAAERSAGNGARVQEIRSVTRDGSGWRVEGDLERNAFTCATANGQIDYIRIDDRQI
jgi:hypothetical protein